MSDKDFELLMDKTELAAWRAFRGVCNGLMGKHKVDESKVVVDELIKCYKDLGCNISLQLHFLHTHLSFFSQKCRG